jgi:cell wall-associated NlpC family hydrolase
VLAFVAALTLATFGILISARDSEAREARTRANAVKIAKEYLGTPYKYGGTNKRGMDCSGLVYRVFHYRMDMTSVPRTAADQWKWRGAVKRVSLSGTKPGDLVFSDFDRNGRVDHVGIAASKDGELKMINALQPGKNLGYLSIDKRYYVGSKRWLRS